MLVLKVANEQFEEKLQNYGMSTFENGVPQEYVDLRGRDRELEESAS
jgi:hypothetical protein